MSDDQRAVDEQKVIEDQAAPTTQADKDQQRAVDDYNKDSDKRLQMKVRIYSPFQDYFDGMAFSLTAESATGPFDILPQHHNFISLLVPCELTIRTVREGERKIKISGGIIHVKADQIIVFLDV